MNATEMTFGIEIECFVPRDAVAAGSYHHGVQVPELPEGWNAQTDGSLHTRKRGYKGVEIVSPKLQGIEGIRQVQTVCRWLNSIGATVNNTCGFHVHVGWNGTRQDLVKCVSLVANFEKAIFATTGTKDRERGGFCRSVAASAEHRGLNYNQQRWNLSRYHVLNLAPIDQGIRSAVEFRAFSGTTSETKIIAYIRLCLGLVERASKLQRTPKWIAQTPVATSPIHRDGVGETAVVRLMYQLGWTKGRTDYTYGDVSGDDLPTIKDSKAELLRLAKKYDEQT